MHTSPHQSWSVWASGGGHLNSTENGLHPILHLRRRPLTIHRACEVTWRRFSDRTAEYITQEYKVHGYWLFTADGKCKTGAKDPRKQIHTLTRGPPQRDTCTLVTYNRVNVIQDMWASAHLVFGTWAPQQTASLRLGSECRSPAGRWLGLAHESINTRGCLLVFRRLMLGKCQEWSLCREQGNVVSTKQKCAVSFHERSRGQARCQRLLQTKIKTALAAVLLYIYEPCRSILGIQCNWTRQT